MNLSANSKIREYKIVKKIGEGGMGEVFLAEDEYLGRKVAIKALAPELLRNSELIERFQQEARLQSSLTHPNIVTLFSFFPEQNTYCMILEYAAGITLKELILHTGAIPEPRSINIFKQILEGVGFAHQKGVIHRDLKPSNIMIDSNDNVKIMDFGIAKILGDRGLTKTGTKMGTIYYMSPEQVRAEKDIDQRTDIYSLGIVLYEMLTGKLPFNTNTESDYEVMNEIVLGSIGDPRIIVNNISEQTALVVQKMCEKKKDNRYVTCYQCGEDFTNREVKIDQPRIYAKAPKIEAPKQKIESPKPKVFIEPEMVLIEGGSFQRESSNALGLFKKTHTVTLNSFYIGKYPITQKEWEAIMGKNPSHFKGDNLPVESVSWTDAQNFLTKLNKNTGQKYRLPTEAEWEYAARGGNKSKGYKYSGSNYINEVAWHFGNSKLKTHSVGSKNPNEIGIYDMSGNVCEWCSDWYDGNYYKTSPGNNPQGPSSGTHRVLHGGSWNYYANFCRSANRSGYYPASRLLNLGFRIARDL